MIDLHCHSHFSDGLLSPKLLIEKAISANIKLLALTDHDTVEGIKTLQEELLPAHVNLISGIELSVRWKKYNIHVLGLKFDLEHPAMLDLIHRQTASRIQRATQMGEKLESLGIKDAYAKACQIAGHERVGRPHFAQVLLEEGKAPDRKTAFKQFLVQGKVAYVPTTWVSLEEAVAIIKEAKGFAVLAHPLKYHLTALKLHELIYAFKLANGCGIEVISGDMTPLQVHFMEKLCLKYQLLASSGSDFHGEFSVVSLGKQQPLPTTCEPIWQHWV